MCRSIGIRQYGHGQHYSKIMDFSVLSAHSHIVKRITLHGRRLDQFKLQQLNEVVVIRGSEVKVTGSISAFFTLISG